MTPGQGSSALSHSLAKSARLALKVLLSVALLAAVLLKAPVAEALRSLQQLSWSALAAIVFLTLLSQLVAAVRWHRVLHALEEKSSVRALLQDVIVAATYNMLLPTSVGGDVIRAYRCARRLPHGHRAWSSTLYERLVGVVALGLMALPGLLIVSKQGTSLSIWIPVLLLSSLALLFFGHIPLLLGASFLARRLPLASEWTQHVAQDLAGPLARAPIRLETLLWSLAYQTTSLGILAVAAIDWGHSDWIVPILGAVPIALVLVMLPISIAGLGVRESLFVVLLGEVGIGSSYALSLALIWLLSSLLLALLGALLQWRQWLHPSTSSSTSQAPWRTP